MTSAQRITLYVAATLAALLFALWIWTGGGSSPPPPINTPTASATAAATATATAPSLPPGYRLSGVAVSGASSYAAIENPGGGTSLYRLNADVPGLGKIVRIEGERVIVIANGAELVMWVAPAPTPTFTVTRRPTLRRTPTRAPTLAGAPSPSPESSP